MPATRKRGVKAGKGGSDVPASAPSPLASPSGDAPVSPRTISSTSSSKNPEARSNQLEPSRMKRVFGFDWAELSSWNRLVALLHAPRDPASMAAWRILFGLLMMIDIPQERGMAFADYRFGDPSECRFPLFNGLIPLSVDWMYVVYLIMYIGAFGIFLGAFYRLSCLLFLVPYWYIFLLDKTVWNNHSYLYGLISLQLLFMDANRLWSIDEWINPNIRNIHIPLWNIALVRFQVFLVYFYAGLKKLDADWVGGYSMENLSHHWIFEPFKLLLTDDQIDYFLVHLGGLFLDLSAGFLLFFDLTRPVGTFFCSSFHLMNSQLFSIGMFPYAMLATTTVFYSAAWPRALCPKLLCCLRSKVPSLDQTPQPSDSCIYPATKENSKKADSNRKTKSSSIKPGQHVAAVSLLVYVCIQLFLPYSHFITKGYNNWTNGLYGYSWDMMIHTWHTQHVKIKYVNGETGEEGYLSPDFWVSSGRWASHGDMTKQYASCIGQHLQGIGTQNPQLYFDVWKSMNGRFQQRMFDPRVDLVNAPWSHFAPTPWLMPLLTELSDWRTKLKEIEDQLADELDVTFVADFPGMYLENFISEDLGNTTIQVLSGKVKVELVRKKRNITLEIGDRIQLPPGAFHNVHTVSAEPSCYMYVFVNTTELAILNQVKDFMDRHPDIQKALDDSDSDFFQDMNISNTIRQRIVERLNAKLQREQKESRSVAEKAQLFLGQKGQIIQRTFSKTRQALTHILLGGESVGAKVVEDQEDEDHHKTHTEL